MGNEYHDLCFVDPHQAFHPCLSICSNLASTLLLVLALTLNSDIFATFPCFTFSRPGPAAASGFLTPPSMLSSDHKQKIFNTQERAIINIWVSERRLTNLLNRNVSRECQSAVVAQAATAALHSDDLNHPRRVSNCHVMPCQSVNNL